MTSSRTTDTAATDAATDEEQAADPKAEDAAAAAEETGESSEGEPAAESAGDDSPAEAAAPTDEADVADEAGDEADEDAGESVAGEPAEPGRSDLSRLAAGAAAVVGAGLGLASLTGTWLSDLISERQELIGQINGQTATPEEQVATIYGTPWHTTALINGCFALAAIVVAGAVLLLPAFRKTGEESPTWVRAVAVGGVALGVIGLVIAAVMWFDVFTDLPAIPEQPALPPG
jgi:hypothetical protein